jgi:4-amino-4-deoxy-L-arabinose transferase-like glycosyltransferase
MNSEISENEQAQPQQNHPRSSRFWSQIMLSPAVTFCLSALFFAFCFTTLTIEPFDFDESVYRRMAEEMKSSGLWMSQPMFNGEAYNHKPPTYIAVLSVASRLLDEAGPMVSAYAGRSVSLIFSFLTLLLIHGTWRRLSDFNVALKSTEATQKSLSISPVYFSLLCFLPTIATTAILLDPLLVFFTTLFVCCEALRIQKQSVDEQDSALESDAALRLGAALGMSGATITKGLIGLVLPAGCVVVYSLGLTVFNHNLGSKNSLAAIRWRSLFTTFFKTGLSFFPQWMVGALFSGFFYAVVWVTGGSDFVGEFFIKHHFGRATSAMEGHDGSIFYYIPILLLGGGLTSAYVILMASTRLKALFNKSLWTAVRSQETPSPCAPIVPLWLLSWCVACVLFFSFLATKLPNYIWPVWPVLALLASLLSRDFLRWPPERPKKIFSFLARILGFALPLVFSVLVFGLYLWEPVLSKWVTLKPREAAIVESVLLRKQPLMIGFGLAGLSHFFAAFLMNSWIIRTLRGGDSLRISFAGVVRVLVALQLLGCLFLAIFVMPAAEEVMIGPVQQATRQASQLLAQGETLATADLYSPTVVSLRQERVTIGIGDGEWVFKDPLVRVVLTPVWNLSMCEAASFRVIQSAEYLRICVRP